MKRNCISIFISILLSYANLFSQALNGVYTIGPSGNYTTINAAVNALSNYGVSGSVVFNIASGTYIEQVSIPSINGASISNCITFQSANGDSSSVLITYNQTYTNPYTLRFNGGSYIKLKKISISTSSTIYGNLVVITNSSHNLDFYNNHLSGIIINNQSSVSDMDLILVDYSNGTSAISYVNFINNRFNYGVKGINYTGWSSSTNIWHHIAIDSNIFYNQSNEFANLYANDITFSNNLMNHTLFNLKTFYGLRIGGSSGNLLCSSNKISIVGYNASGPQFFFTANQINPGIIKNNFISINSIGGGTVVRISYSSNLMFLNNSILAQDTSNMNTSSTTLKLESSNSSISIINNILWNKTHGYAILYNGTTTANVDCDYNCLSTNGFYIGGLSTTNNAVSLANWVSLSGGDSNSVSINPNYYSNTDLHVSNPLFDNLGTTLSNVIKDIDGELRSSTAPDIGADEYTFSAKDIAFISIYPVNLGECLSNTETIKVKLKNIGSQTINFSIDTLKINVSVSGANPLSFPQKVISTGSLPHDSTVTFIISSSYNMQFHGLFNFSGFAKISADLNHGNDSIDNQNFINYLITNTHYIQDFETFSPGINSSSIIGELNDGWERLLYPPGYYYNTAVYKGLDTSFYTGPMADHSSGTSNGIYILMIGSQSSNSVEAKLYSPCVDLPANITYKLGFWYHMFGNNIQSLNVDILLANGTWQNNVWTKVGQQQTSKSAAWQSALIDLSNYSGVTKIRFRGVKSGINNHIAIDDISLFTMPYVNIGNDTSICQNGSLTLDANFQIGYSYEWKKIPSQNIIGTSHLLTVNSPGTYYVKVTNSYSMSSFDTINVSQIAALSLSIGNDSLFCNYAPINFIGANAANYDSVHWSTNGSGIFNNPQTINATYYPSVSDFNMDSLQFILYSSNLCESISLSTFLKPKQAPYLNLGPDKTICYYNNLILDAGFGFLSYLWQDNTSNQTFLVDSTTGSGNYWVKAVALDGCYNIDSVYITIDSCISIPILSQKRMMRILPNPAHNLITIQFDKPFDFNRIEILSSTGQILNSKNLNLSSNTIELNISSLPKAIYFIKVLSKDGSVVIQHFMKI